MSTIPSSLHDVSPFGGNAAASQVHVTAPTTCDVDTAVQKVIATTEDDRDTSPGVSITSSTSSSVGWSYDELIWLVQRFEQDEGQQGMQHKKRQIIPEIHQKMLDHRTQVLPMLYNYIQQKKLKHQNKMMHSIGASRLESASHHCIRKYQLNCLAEKVQKLMQEESPQVMSVQQSNVVPSPASALTTSAPVQDNKVVPSLASGYMHNGSEVTIPLSQVVPSTNPTNRAKMTSQFSSLQLNNMSSSASVKQHAEITPEIEHRQSSPAVPSSTSAVQLCSESPMASRLFAEPAVSTRVSETDLILNTCSATSQQTPAATSPLALEAGASATQVVKVQNTVSPVPPVITSTYADRHVITSTYADRHVTAAEIQRQPSGDDGFEEYNDNDGPKDEDDGNQNTSRDISASTSVSDRLADGMTCDDMLRHLIRILQQQLKRKEEWIQQQQKHHEEWLEQQQKCHEEWHRQLQEQQMLRYQQPQHNVDSRIASGSGSSSSSSRHLSHVPLGILQTGIHQTQLAVNTNLESQPLLEPAAEVDTT